MVWIGLYFYGHISTGYFILWHLSRYLIHLSRECLSDKCFSQDPQTDSAVSMCSSDNEYSKDKDKHSEDKEKDKKKRRGRRILDKTLKERRSSKTLTEQDIKHIERHLSMKRTIR